MDFKLLENQIGYGFKNPLLLQNAMIHSSYANEQHMNKLECNERLEFLGDAVLEVVSSEFLFFEHPEMAEGELTKLRASIVCEPTLAYCARQINLGSFLLLGKGEEATGGRKRNSIVSDALEALIGAIYMDGGFASAKEFILKFILNDLENKKLFYDSKTILQEIVQSNYSEKLVYRLLEESGPDHNKIFKIGVYIGQKLFGIGQGRAKKLAEQEAAYQTILMLQNNDKE